MKTLYYPYLDKISRKSLLVYSDNKNVYSFILSVKFGMCGPDREETTLSKVSKRNIVKQLPFKLCL